MLSCSTGHLATRFNCSLLTMQGQPSRSNLGALSTVGGALHSDDPLFRGSHQAACMDMDELRSLSQYELDMDI